MRYTSVKMPGFSETLECNSSLMSVSTCSFTFMRFAIFSPISFLAQFFVFVFLFLGISMSILFGCTIHSGHCWILVILRRKATTTYKCSSDVGSALETSSCFSHSIFSGFILCLLIIYSFFT